MSFANHSLSYNGTNLSTYGLYVTRVDGIWGMPAPRYSKEPIACGDGVVTDGNTYNERVITVDYMVKAPTSTGSATIWAQNKSMASSIATVLRAGQDDGEKNLIFDCDTGRTWKARVDTEISPVMFQADHEGTLTFVCPNPWAVGAEVTQTSTGAQPVWTPVHY
jgi:predicted phage tail component-like protein